ncbi:MAG: hypothetical protein RBS13_04365 [Bacteroidales bacterium]|jgi:carbon monoxide dehydrogenase subunit G|nr:hypothetical protein [Bacteroidales bacterium]
MNISSNEVRIQAKDETVYQMISDCNHFRQYLPEIQNWQSTENSCNFTVQGIGNIEMNITQKNAFSTVVFDVKNAQIKSLSIVFDIKNNENTCLLSGHSNIDIPIFVAQMLKPSLQKFLNLLVERIKLAVETHVATS